MEKKPHVLEVFKLAPKDSSICHISVKQTLQSVRQTEIIFNQIGVYKWKLMKSKKVKEKALKQKLKTFAITRKEFIFLR